MRDAAKTTIMGLLWDMYDMTHLEEIMLLNDLSVDPSAVKIENFKKRSLDNYNNRGLHHHVYDLNVMTQMVEFLGFKCVCVCQN